MSELLILETALVAIAALIASVMPRRGVTAFNRLEMTLGYVARRRTLAALGIIAAIWPPTDYLDWLRSAMAVVKPRSV